MIHDSYFLILEAERARGPPQGPQPPGEAPPAKRSGRDDALLALFGLLFSIFGATGKHSKNHDFLS